MEENKRRICFQYVLLLLIVGFSFQLSASADTIFYESFDEDFDGRWIVPEKDEYQGVDADKLSVVGLSSIIHWCFSSSLCVRRLLAPFVTISCYSCDCCQIFVTNNICWPWTLSMDSLSFQRFMYQRHGRA